MQNMVFAKSPSRHEGETRARHRERGFTLVEVMIALTVLLIGVAGILAMHMTSMHATAYSRHATEASVLGEDKMEELRTIPVETVMAGGPVTVDAQGIADPDGMYTITWNMVWDPLGTGVGVQTVTVAWKERGYEDHAIVFRTQRSQEL
jgi:prepilin-type N-terminal cleavage/methylation domain-containing protein